MRIELLDSGYIEFVESWGSDERIIEAARMSTNKGFRGWGPMCPNASVETDASHDLRKIAPSSDSGPSDFPARCILCGPVQPKSGDEKLLAYLWNNKHATPFEMAGLVVEVKAPIMVFREWHRHRTQSFNELSARYTPLPDENYHPTIERLLLGSDGKSRQAGTICDAEVLTEDSALEWGAELAEVYAHAQRVYESGLRRGVPKELARLCVPVARYSRMRASANLRNWLAFLTLRMAPNAQWEIRQFANALGRMVASEFPRTWALFDAPEAA